VAMTDQEKFDYWYEYAENDLRVAAGMQQLKHYTYTVFMCQQSIEKLVKGLYGLYLGFDGIPRIHNISTLVKRFQDKLPSPISEEYHTLFNVLSFYYLTQRYPEDIKKLSEAMSEAEAEALLSKTQEAFAWLLTMKA
jgi:HEPN domain-containing protein